MASKSSNGAARHPVTFHLDVDDYRSHRIPGIEGAKVGSCYIRAKELVDRLDLDGWMEINPRVPNRNAKEVLTGHVVRGIRQTLAEVPENFALMNQGLFLLTDHIADYDRRKPLSITLADPTKHGLCNGGHTYAAIREYVDTHDDTSDADPRDAWVRLHLFQGISAERVTAMAEGLNRSKQVDDPSLMDLAENFAEIKQVLKGKPGAAEISYHQGDNGTYYVTEVIRAIMFFNGKRYDSRKHPNALYRQQKKMVGMFADDLKADPSPVSLIIPHTHEILRLMDQIAKATPDAAARLPRPFVLGRMKLNDKKGAPRAGSQQHKTTSLHFIDDTMDHKIPNGWLMVMLAAFRANVDWDLDAGTFKWRVPVDQLLPGVIDDMVRICVNEYRENKSRPDEMARNASIYEQCYDKVLLELHKRSAQPATERSTL